MKEKLCVCNSFCSSVTTFNKKAIRGLFKTAIGLLARIIKCLPASHENAVPNHTSFQRSPS